MFQGADIAALLYLCRLLYYLTHPREFYQLLEGPNHKENIRMYLELQKKYEIGRIMDVKKSTKDSRNEYEAIVEITDPHAIRLLKARKLSPYVSPSIYRLNIDDHPSAITDYEPINLTIVDSPAYGIQVANVRSICEGNSSGCQRMLLQNDNAKATFGLQTLEEIDKGVSKLQSKITKLQTQIDDLLAWKESSASEIEGLLKFASDS
jgi:hypothetical protein